MRAPRPAAFGALTAGCLVPVLLVARAWRARRRRVDEIVLEAAYGFAGADGDQAVTAVARRAAERLRTIHGRAGRAAHTSGVLGELERAARERLPTRESGVPDETAYAVLVEQASDVMLIVDDSGRIRFASPSSRLLFGTSLMGGRRFLDFVEPAERRTAEFLLDHVRRGDADGARAHADLTIRAANGRTSRAEVLCRNLRSDESVRGLVITLRDVTGQRRLEHELTRHVFWDQLTGIPNRASFQDALTRAVAADAGITAVLILDLYRFRVINESLGRATGDAVLSAVAHRLSTAAGVGNLTARLGGDEFAVLSTDNDSLDAVNETADRIMRSLAPPVPAGDDLVPVGACMGVATSIEAASEPDLLRHADVALDAARAAGPGSWRRYDPSMVKAAQYRLELLTALGPALRDGSLVVLYQPIVSLRTGRTAGFEALVRWQHPTRGLLTPAEFIDIAEDSDLIHTIGEHVLTSAIAACRRWAGAGTPEPPYVSVNVSVRQFRSPEFTNTVRRLLAGAAVPPDRLILEITESLLLRDDDQIWEDLTRLRGWGVRIAIDDFGTGYSALGYLRQVPLDIVKLDRVFVATMVSSSRQRDLVRGIVSLVRTLDLEVVAEGIETPRQREICAAIGCSYGQGYLFARPMAADDATAWLERSASPVRR